MGSVNKPSPAPTTTARSKKSPKCRIITLKLSPKSLARFAPIPIIKEESESQAPSSTTSNTLPAATASPGENASESTSNTPAPSVTDSTIMPPPTDGVKKAGKTGVKRSSAAADGLLKPRGKPGPKKRVKLEDAAVDNTLSTAKGPSTTGATAAHKLGPKANQGAINAGLRALDRSGTPCRKWHRISFQVKTFTGVEWEVSRWSAPPKVKINGESEGSASGESSKENKESSQLDSEKSNSAGDIDIGSIASINASSPAPAVSTSA